MANANRTLWSVEIIYSNATNLKPMYDLIFRLNVIRITSGILTELKQIEDHSF